MKKVVDDQSIFVFYLSQFWYRKYLGEKLLKKAEADLAKKDTALVAAEERAVTAEERAVTAEERTVTAEERTVTAEERNGALEKEIEKLRAKLIGRDAKNEGDINSGPEL